jgi:glycosyltransferase involved in cell wall biosynthesis
MKVSVVIPVHNGEKYLAQAIESVLAQTFRDFELLIVDDGSTDGSRAIAELYARHDGRIRVFSQPNRGVAAAGNRGLQEANGEWVARLDADDVFHPEKLERQIAFINHYPAVKLVGTLAWFINRDGRRLGLVGTEGPFRPEEFHRLAGENSPVYFVHSSTLMHGPTVLAIGGYREPFVLAEDVDLWIRMAERGHLMLKVAEPLVLYRLHGASLTMTRNAEQRRHQRWALACARARKNGRNEPTLEEFSTWEKKRSWSKRVHDFTSETGEILYQRAALHYSCGDYFRTLSLVAASLLLNPWHVIPRLYARKIEPLISQHLKWDQGTPITGVATRKVQWYAPGK